MSESTAENRAVAGAPPTPYTEAMGGERAEAGRVHWWRDVRQFWMAIAAICASFFIASWTFSWSTQRDLGLLRAEMVAMRGEILTETGERIARLEKELGEQIAVVRQEAAEQNAELRREMVELRQEMVELHADQQAQISDLAQRITRIETLLEVLVEEYRARNPESGVADPGGP